MLRYVAFLLVLTLHACSGDTDRAPADAPTDVTAAADSPADGADRLGSEADSEAGDPGPTVSDASDRDTPAGPVDAEGDGGADASDAPAGPPIGFIDTTIDGPDGLRLPLAIWYPAAADASGGRAKYLNIMQGEAMREVPAAEGTHPIILFSHGSHSIRVQSYNLCEAWAAAGYVVAAPDHVGNRLSDANDDDDMARNALRRPRDLGAALEAVEAFAAADGHPLEGHVDPERVGVAGHSFGGFTALAAAGASTTVAKARVACGLSSRSFVCEFLEHMDDATVLKAPDNLAHIRASVSMSPAGYVFLGAEGLGAVTAATLVLVGDIDDVTPSDEQSERIYADLPAPKGLGIVHGTGHYGFSILCRVPGLAALSDFLQEQCDTSRYIDDTIVAEIAIDLSLRWFDRHLRDLEVEMDVDDIEGRWPDFLTLELTDSRVEMGVR